MPRLERRGDLAGLRAALGYRKIVADEEGEWDLGASVRVEAVEALSRFYGPLVADGLTEALRDPHEAVRLAAVDGIARLGVPTAIDELLEGVVSWQDPPYGEAAARALDTLTAWKLPGLAERCAELLLRPDPEMLEERHREALAELVAHDPRGAAAATALARALLARPPGPNDGVAEVRAEEILVFLGPDAARPLVDAISNGPVGPGAVRAAGFLGDVRLLDPLVRLLGHADPALRAAAATALGRLEDTRAVMPLLGATRDSHRPVRSAASDALNTMGMSAVIVGIAGLIGSGNPALAHGGKELPRMGEAGWVEQAVTRLLRRPDDPG